MFLSLGLERLKPFLTALLLPPVPFLLLALVALALLRRRRRGGSTTLLVALALVWLSGCLGSGQRIAPLLLRVPPALESARVDALRQERNSGVAIVVLGSGVEGWAPEYRGSSLQFRSLERLRYGIWLGRRTGWPVGFSGGLGWGQPSTTGAREGAVAQKIATEEYRQPLKWIEDGSRDTRENAQLTVAMLKPFGIRHIVLVTHGWHMPRAMRNFQRAGGPDVLIEAAPIGLASGAEWPVLRWLPSGKGLLLVRAVLREWLGLLSGA